MNKTLANLTIAKEFHYERNAPLRPEDFKQKSNKKIWWKCGRGHEWQSTISNRSRTGCGCPFCAGKLPTEYNNLSIHKISEEFHPTKNGNNTPKDFTLHSEKKVWWKCSHGHEWEARISTRTDKRTTPVCPICSGRYSSSTNNLSLHLVAKEFHYERNSPLTPEDFTLKSNKKIWWKCEKGHEWESSVNNRVRLNSGCPTCASSGTSQGEKQILEFITSLNLIPSYRSKLDGVEADIFIPEKNLAIEYNGLYWHSALFKDKNYHYMKYRHFADRGIQLIQIWEDEWRDKQDIIKSILKQKLGVSSNRIFARKCNFVEGDFSQFIEDNHISGDVRASRYLGLEYEGELVAAISLRKPFHKKWSSYTEIARFCTKQNTAVIGGLSKVLSKISEPLITYADCRFGSGDSYETVGFKRDGHTGVSLEWTNGYKRFNRFKFKARDGKSQEEIAKEANVSKLWGPGSWRLVSNL